MPRGEGFGSEGGKNRSGSEPTTEQIIKGEAGRGESYAISHPEGVKIQYGGTVPATSEETVIVHPAKPKISQPEKRILFTPVKEEKLIIKETTPAPSDETITYSRQVIARGAAKPEPKVVLESGIERIGKKIDIWEKTFAPIARKAPKAVSLFGTQEELQKRQKEFRETIPEEAQKGLLGKLLYFKEKKEETGLALATSAYTTLKQEPIALGVKTAAYTVASAYVLPALAPLFAKAPVITKVAAVGLPTSYVGVTGYRLGQLEAGAVRGAAAGEIFVSQVLPATVGTLLGRGIYQRRIAPPREAKAFKPFKGKGAGRDVIKELSKDYLSQQVRETSESVIESTRLTRRLRYKVQAATPPKEAIKLYTGKGEYGGYVTQKPLAPPKPRVVKVGLSEIIGTPKQAPAPTAPTVKGFKPVGIASTVQPVLGVTPSQTLAQPALKTLFKPAVKTTLAMKPFVKLAPPKVSILPPLIPTITKERQVLVQVQKPVQEQKQVQKQQQKQVQKLISEPVQVQATKQAQRQAFKVTTLPAQVQRQRQSQAQVQKLLTGQPTVSAMGVSAMPKSLTVSAQKFIPAVRHRQLTGLEAVPREPLQQVYGFGFPDRRDRRKKKVRPLTWYGEQYNPIPSAKAYKKMVFGKLVI